MLSMRKDHSAHFVRYQGVLPFLLFGALLLLGLSIHRDFGVSLDELVQQDYGRAVLSFYTQGDRRFLGLHEAWYGPLFELACAFAEVQLGLSSSESVLHLRRLITYGLFLLALIALYQITKRIFESHSLALLAVILMIASPRIFTHSFINTKDIPALSFFILSFFTLLLFGERSSYSRAALHGVVNGLLIDIRITGILIVLLTMLVAFMRLGVKSERGRPAMYALIVYSLSMVITVVLFWPLLWVKPLANFAAALGLMKNYPLTVPALYQGELFASTALPWHYSFTWIAITTPITVLFFGVVGLVAAPFAKRFGVKRLYIALIGLWLCVPLVSVVLFESALYDGWRQLYFVYPALVLCAVYAVHVMSNLVSRRHVVLKVLAALIVCLGGYDLSQVTSFMIHAHPNQHIYFNQFVGGVAGAKGNFEMDYWGLSSSGLLREMLETKPSATLSVAGRTYKVGNAVDIAAHALPKELRSRLRVSTEPSQAQYFLTTFRAVLDQEQNVFASWTDVHPRFNNVTPSYVVVVDNVAISALYRQ